MVSGTVIGALIGVIGSVIGYSVAGWFNLKSTDKQIEAENQRLLADIALQKKIEDLSELHTELTQCQEEFGRILSFGEWGNEIDVTDEEFTETLLPLIESYSVAMQAAKIHLSPEQQLTLEKAEDELLKAASLVKRESPHLEYSPDVQSHSPEDASWMTVQRACTEAQAVLRTEIKEPIEDIDSE